MYRIADKSEPLRQGEIITDLTRAVLDLDQLPHGKFPESGIAQFRQLMYRFAIVVSQDCDLEQDFRVRQLGDEDEIDRKRVRLLPEVLFCVAEAATILKTEPYKNALGRSTSRAKLVQENKDERFHYLAEVPSDQDSLGAGIAPLLIEFRRYFTIPTDEIYRRIEQRAAFRRCVLVPPYRDHFATRFHYYQYRIALPE